ncbi:hypothetical protein GUJ93_ZPchr0004g39239 [Zizania palustris]|uniref:Uncharacterized protein n=1 Tax=Zizania palustris TaxID=103762 RepID=A0A8J5VZ07_ZIZPA|nr:hypothetical protein GUJ93_ZPchr0004g39239 [Zizania palustris]
MMSPFPTFIKARSLLLLDELNDDTGNPAGKASAFVADSRSTPTQATDNGGGSRGNGNGNNGKKGKGKGKQGGHKGFNTNSSPSPLPAQPCWNPWTGQIQLWPTAGLLGPRPGAAPRPAPPQAYMGIHQPMQPTAYGLSSSTATTTTLPDETYEFLDPPAVPVPIPVAPPPPPAIERPTASNTPVVPAVPTVAPTAAPQQPIRIQTRSHSGIHCGPTRAA